MAQVKKTVNTPEESEHTTIGGKATLLNVSLCLGALENARNRPIHLPGFVVFYGPSGYGKSTAAAVARNTADAYYIQAQSSWTRKAFCLAVLEVMGITAGKTIYEMSALISRQLSCSNRPLIIDEADYLVDKGIIESVRDIYEASGAAIMLIGEENLPNNLKRWERMHGRVLEFVPAEPATFGDAQKLCALYANKVNISNDLLKLVHEKALGSIRRICVNLERIQNVAITDGLKSIDKATWGERTLYTGEAPARRVR